MNFSQLPATRWDRVLAVLEEVDPSLAVSASHLVKNQKKLQLSDVEFFYYLLVYYQDFPCKTLREVLNICVLTQTWSDWLKEVHQRLKEWSAITGHQFGYHRVRMVPPSNTVPEATEESVSALRKNNSTRNAQKLFHFSSFSRVNRERQQKSSVGRPEPLSLLPPSSSSLPSFVFTSNDELVKKLCHWCPSLKQKLFSSPSEYPWTPVASLNASFPHHCAPHAGKTETPNETMHLPHSSPISKIPQSSSGGRDSDNECSATPFSASYKSCTPLDTPHSPMDKNFHSPHSEHSGSDSSISASLMKRVPSSTFRCPNASVPSVTECVRLAHSLGVARHLTSDGSSRSSSSSHNGPMTAVSSMTSTTNSTTEGRERNIFSAGGGEAMRHRASGNTEVLNACGEEMQTRIRKDRLPHSFYSTLTGSSASPLSSTPATPLSKTTHLGLPSSVLEESPGGESFTSRMTPGAAVVASGHWHPEFLVHPYGTAGREGENRRNRARRGGANTRKATPSPSVSPRLSSPSHTEGLGGSCSGDDRPPPLAPVGPFVSAYKDEGIDEYTTGMKLETNTVLHNLLYKDSGDSILEPLRNGEFLCQLIVDLLEFRKALSVSFASDAAAQQNSSTPIVSTHPNWSALRSRLESQEVHPTHSIQKESDTYSHEVTSHNDPNTCSHTRPWSSTSSRLSGTSLKTSTTPSLSPELLSSSVSPSSFTSPLVGTCVPSPSPCIGKVCGKVCVPNAAEEPSCLRNHSAPPSHFTDAPEMKRQVTPDYSGFPFGSSSGSPSNFSSPLVSPVGSMAPSHLTADKKAPWDGVLSAHERADFFLSALNELCDVIQPPNHPLSHTSSFSSSVFFDPKKFNPGGVMMNHCPLGILETQVELHGLQRLHWLAMVLYDLFKDPSIIPRPSAVSYIYLDRTADVLEDESGEVGVQIATCVSCLPHQIDMDITFKGTNLCCQRSAVPSFSASTRTSMVKNESRKRGNKTPTSQQKGSIGGAGRGSPSSMRRPVMRSTSPNRGWFMEFPCAMVKDQVYAFQKDTQLFLPVVVILQELLRGWESLSWTFGTDALTRKRLLELGLSSGASTRVVHRETPRGIRRLSDSMLDQGSLPAGNSDRERRERRKRKGKTYTTVSGSGDASFPTGEKSTALAEDSLLFLSTASSLTVEHGGGEGVEEGESDADDDAGEEARGVMGFIARKRSLSSLSSSSFSSSVFTYSNRKERTFDLKVHQFSLSHTASLSCFQEEFREMENEHTSPLLLDSVAVEEERRREVALGEHKTVTEGRKHDGVGDQKVEVGTEMAHKANKDGGAGMMSSDDSSEGRELFGTTQSNKSPFHSLHQVSIEEKEEVEENESEKTEPDSRAGQTESHQNDEEEVPVSGSFSSLQKMKSKEEDWKKEKDADAHPTLPLPSLVVSSPSSSRMVLASRETTHRSCNAAVALPSEVSVNATESTTKGTPFCDVPSLTAIPTTGVSFSSPLSPPSGRDDMESSLPGQEKKAENEKESPADRSEPVQNETPEKKKSLDTNVTGGGEKNEDTEKTGLSGAAVLDTRTGTALVRQNHERSEKIVTIKEGTSVSKAAAVPFSNHHSSTSFLHSRTGDFSATIVSESGDSRIEVISHHFRIRGDIIGKGAFGAVFKALNLETGAMVAVKQSRFSLEGGNRQVLNWREFELWSMLPPHPNVIQFYGASIDEQTHQILLVLEYASGGSIISLYKKFSPISRSLLLQHARGIALGLCHLHDHSVLHGDVKPENVLTRSDGSIAISDFGCSQVLYHLQHQRHMTDRNYHSQKAQGKSSPSQARRQSSNRSARKEDAHRRDSPFVLSEEKTSAMLAGTIPYMAPEVALSKPVLSSDVWAFACTIMYLWTGERPWTKSYASYQEGEGIALLYYMCSTENAIPYTKRQIVSTPKWLQSVAARAFVRDPGKRCSMREILTILTSAS